MAEDAFVAFLNDRQSRNLVQNAKLDAKVQNGSVRNAAWEFRSKRSPGILLVDLDGEQNPIVYVPALIQVCRPESIILVTGSENNVALANELYRSGVFLYLPKPLDTTNLAAAMREVAAVNGEGARPDIQASRLLPVLGKGMGTNYHDGAAGADGGGSRALRELRGPRPQLRIAGDGVRHRTPARPGAGAASARRRRQRAGASAGARLAAHRPRGASGRSVRPGFLRRRRASAI